MDDVTRVAVLDASFSSSHDVDSDFVHRDLDKEISMPSHLKSLISSFPLSLSFNRTIDE